MKNSNPLTDPAAAKALKNPEWVALHLPRFKRIQPSYRAYEQFLIDCLKEAAAKIAPLSKVEARAKSLASFAEKILRKRALYQDPSDPQPPDPLVRLTDLCGGRVIAETSAQVEAFCRFIKEAFDIDWANSEDVRERLKPTEFGYRSVHYIVIPSEKKLRAAGITTPIPKQILGLKAELQVRTLLEHAWSDLGHDLLYKSDLSVPNILKRQFAAVAAVLESADREFERLLAGFDDYKASLGGHHSRTELTEELVRLEIVLQYDPVNAGIALRIGRVALAIGEYRRAIKALDCAPFRDNNGTREMLGILLTELHWDAPEGAGFRRGCVLLERAVAENPSHSEALRTLAECRARGDRPAEARELFQRALAADPTDPVTVCRYLEFESDKKDHSAMQLVLPMIRAAMTRARKQIDGRVNLPNAWSALAILHLLADEPYAALSALSQLITLCRISRADAKKNSPPCACTRALQRTKYAVERLRTLATQIEGFACFERLLLIGHAAVLNDTGARQEIDRLKSKRLPVDNPDAPVVILAGGCASDIEPAVAKFRPLLVEAAKDTGFTLISGGTETGITALACDLAGGSGGRIRNVGYVPGTLCRLTRGEAATARRAFVNPSTGKDFSPLEPLQSWTDLLAAGVDPARVRLLCYAPGDIARAEIVIGLALGARVGLVENPELPRERQFDDPHWTGVPGFLPLPMDVATLHVFLTLDTAPLSKKEKRRFEPAAIMAHNDYVKSATPRDPSLQPWEKLDPALQESNYQQVVFWKKILATLGLKVRVLSEAEKKNKDTLPPPLDMEKTLGSRTLEKLARLEHGRWNVERLAYGWRYAKQKDVPKRQSPFLVPWEQVPVDIQKYDINAIIDLPTKLREAGLEIGKM